jgi:RNA polymerase sigma-70 factor (ECF subfamily)
MALPYLLSSFADDPPSRLAHVPARPSERAAIASTRVIDEERVLRIRAGDDEAYGALFTELYPQLHEFASTYVRNVAVAEEIVQEVFLDLWVRRAEWDPRAGIRAYLFRAVRNRAANAIRDAHTALRLDSALPDAGLGEPPESPDVTDPSDALAKALAPTIATFPPARRRAALLRWRFGLSYAEIAEALETSVASVTMHIARAREAVRPAVERYLAEQ